MSAYAIEGLGWRRVFDAPDDGETVLVACADGQVYQGFLDGELWRDHQALPLRQPVAWAPWPVGPEVLGAEAMLPAVPGNVRAAA